MSASMWREMEDEVERLRLLLAHRSVKQDGAVHCEHPPCLATIDPVLVPGTQWVADRRGWWCPAHEGKSRP